MSGRLFTLRWVALHALALVCVLGFLRLAWWQWDRSQATGSWQNFGYALQWPLLAGFVVFFWWKLVRQALHRDIPAAPAADRPVLPRRARPTAVTPDAELAAYNERLARLADPDPDRGASS